jgi:sulfite exporter TauE/SafE
MYWSILLSGFTLGAAGSLHCIGMCGPLSLALPVHHLPVFKKFLSLLLYQAGRITTYASIGLVIGLAGRRIYLAGIQQPFSIIMGMLLLMLAALHFARKQNIRVKGIDHVYVRVQKVIGNILRSPHGMTSFFLLGMANGLLPCGMVYIALAATLSFNEIGQSISFMAMFGAGTLPAMMLLGFTGTLISFRQRMNLKRIMPVFITLMGLMLILRGLDLGIPYISPALPHSPGKVVPCHP